ncbi:TetR/AcrR family transcriptional regulator [Nocardia sp. CNY236]|uniref:TetR/AcrR family transcriptional regulator n=1 Tax=Nocardia sp. CNY236 TaxID=1169152 RepID=UPI0004021BD7|nr:TetR/AcrR family transcriptional regulator C-terminal domain-containing protein [Nocardia sp. CNY236]
MPPRPSVPKRTLIRSRVLAEAVALADELGVDALSMRKLADRMGVGTMSLYTHVANKDDLVEGIVDMVVQEIDVPAATEDWRRAIGDSAASAHRVLLAHPWVAGEWTKRMPGPARLRFMEAILATLTRAGLDESLVYRGYHAITMHIVGFTIQELGYRSAGGDAGLDDLATGFLDSLAAADLPHLATHVRAHLGVQDYGDEFGFVLGLLLDGLQRAHGPERDSSDTRPHGFGHR